MALFIITKLIGIIEHSLQKTFLEIDQPIYSYSLKAATKNTTLLIGTEIHFELIRRGINQTPSLGLATVDALLMLLMLMHGCPVNGIYALC